MANWSSWPLIRRYEYTSQVGGNNRSGHGVDQAARWRLDAMCIAVVHLGLIRLIGHVLSQPLGAVPLALGIAGFLFVWRRWLNQSALGRWLIAFEHELTHAIFAWCTGHRITAIHASADSGGEVRFVGRGNWLITLAPYFFPTAAIVLLLLAYLMRSTFCLGPVSFWELRSGSILSVLIARRIAMPAI